MRAIKLNRKNKCRKIFKNMTKRKHLCRKIQGTYAETASKLKYRIYCNKRPGAYKNFPISGGAPIREGRLKERGGYIIIFVLRGSA